MVNRIALRPLLRVLRHRGMSRAWAELKPLLRERLLPALSRQRKQSAPLPPALFRMATSFWLSQGIYVAAKLGIADHLQDGPRSCASLASITGCDPAALFRLLRALSDFGLFETVGGDAFAMTTAAEPLRSEVPGSLREIVITIGEIHYRACGSLLHSIQTGSPAFKKVFGCALFAYLQGNDASAEAFHGGMTNLASLLSHAVLMNYDFSPFSSIVDVGGGEGTLLRRILDLYSQTKGIVVDLPQSVELVRQQATADASQCSFVAGDFFVSLPSGADLYMLCQVLHDWDDARAVSILSNCRRAMSIDGRLLLIEMIVPENGAASFSKLLDLNMLVMTGGRERTKDEFSRLLDAAGLRISRIIPTMAPQSMIEARPIRQ